MRIGLDFDDVIVNTEKLKHIYYSNALGASMLAGVEHISKTTLVAPGTITPERYGQLQRAMYADRELALQSLEPRPGAIAGIQTLQQLGHSLTIVTARSEEPLAIAQLLIARMGLELDFTGVGYGNSKSDALVGFDAFIDDDPSHLVPLLGQPIHPFILSTAENRSFVQDGITRVESWEEFIECIQKLSGEC